MLSFSELGSLLLTLMGAYLLALPIGWERERRHKSLGLRTFPLVSMSSAAYVLIAVEVFAGNDEAQARVIQGVVTGIGFIGAGAILKRERAEEVSGTATAASVWATGALGAAIALGRADIAVIISVMTYLTLRWITRLEDHIP